MQNVTIVQEGWLPHQVYQGCFTMYSIDSVLASDSPSIAPSVY